MARLTSAAAKQAFGSWVGKDAEYTVFATVTLRDPESRGARGTHTAPGWALAVKASKALVRTTNSSAWVLVFEQQVDRGVPHVHALIACPWATGAQRVDGTFADEGVRARIIDAQEALYLAHGITRLKAYDPQRGAAYYIGKYLTKAASYLTIGKREPGADAVFW